jgi:excisionase family DNA binding protein
MTDGLDPNRQTLTVEEAARTLGISRTLAYEAARSGELPTVRIGKRLLVPKIALARILCESDSSTPSSISKLEGAD